MDEYGFDPNFILKSLISVYASFIDYKEFLNYVVKDQRSYKVVNFEKVLRIANRGKTKFNFDLEITITRMYFLNFKGTTQYVTKIKIENIYVIKSRIM